MRKILHVVGARPNFMKAAPIIRDMAARSGCFEQFLVHTGQHYDEHMSQVFFDELGIPAPDINLNVGSGSHTWQVAEIMLRFEAVARDIQPDWLVVVGDVNSTVACALVCQRLGQKVAHVEAGLRAHDRSMPEEINRMLTDQLSDLLFAPSGDAVANLEREGISPDRICLVGNVMIDSLVWALPAAQKRQPNLSKQLGADRYALATLHRPGNVDDPDRLESLIKSLETLSRHIPIVFPVHPRTRQRLIDNRISTDTRLILIDPLPYLDFLGLLTQARLVLTDSGGIQEESTYLGIPCLTLRPNTERPVTITNGTNRLVRPGEDLISAAVTAIETSGRAMGLRPPLWDGQTAGRISQALLERV